MKLMVAVLLGLLLSALMTVTATAGSITVNNKTNKDISLAFVYWHPEYEDWVIDAWFKVKAGLSRKIEKPVGGKIYWYGQAWVAGKRLYWPGRKNQQKFWPVINTEMFGVVGSQVQGKNPRKAGFKEVRSADCQVDCEYTISLK